MRRGADMSLGARAEALEQMHADIAKAQAAEAKRRGWDRMDVMPDGRLVERDERP